MTDMKDPALDYFRHVMETKEWSAADLAREAGVSHSTINRPLTTPDWKSVVSRKTIEAVHRASGIDPGAFLPTSMTGGIAAYDNEAPSAAMISVYNVQASAGLGLVVDDEYVVEQLAFPPNYLRHITKSPAADLAIISVKGDSMAPTLKDDDVVMIDTKKRDLSWGGIFVLRVDGDGLLVKRVSMGSQKGMFKIVSDNPSFPPVERRADDVEVIGRVIWYGVKV